MDKRSTSGSTAKRPDLHWQRFRDRSPHDTPFPAPRNFATLRGAVTCLKVNGDQATIGGVLTSGYGYTTPAPKANAT